MGREEFIRGLQVPQNKRPQNKRPKRKIKLNQDIKYKRRRALSALSPFNFR